MLITKFLMQVNHSTTGRPAAWSRSHGTIKKPEPIKTVKTPCSWESEFITNDKFSAVVLLSTRQFACIEDFVASVICLSLFSYVCHLLHSQ